MTLRLLILLIPLCLLAGCSPSPFETSPSTSPQSSFDLSSPPGLPIISPEPLGPPTGLRAQLLSDGSVELRWRAPSPEKLIYQLWRDGEPVGSPDPGLVRLDTPSPGQHRYAVDARAIDGRVGAISEEVPIFVGTIELSLRGHTGSEGEAVLDWQTNVAVDYFELRRDGRPLVRAEGEHFRDFPAGAPARTYSYQIEAFDAAGVSLGSSTSIDVLVEPPNFPWAGEFRRHGPRSDNVVALTFDDCYSRANIERIVAILREYEVPATFFCTGRAVAAAPELFADLATDFTLANHSWNHPNLTRLEASEIDRQISRAAILIESSTGRPLAPVLRPPGGDSSPFVIEAARRHGLLVNTWDIDTRDWRRGATVESVIDAALRARGGSVILMHDRAISVAALTDIINHLRERGLEFVDLVEMFDLPRANRP